MAFYEFHDESGRAFLFDPSSGWEIYDFDLKKEPARWVNHNEGRNLSCSDSYAYVRSRLLSATTAPPTRSHGD